MATYQIPSDVVTDVATKTFVNNMLPAGTVIIWAGTTVPEGYLLCDGSEISRTTYDALFSAIGTTYGAGDSSSTFNLPNFQGRYLKQGTSGTYGSESLPNITGNATLGSAGQNSLIVGHWSGYGFFSTIETTDGPVVSSGGTTTGATHRVLTADASRSSSIYKNNAKVNPDNAEILYCIKY